MFDGSSEPAGVILAAGVMFATGALDDLRDVSPPAKIAGMVLAGSLLSLFGVSMLFFHVPFSGADVIVLSPDLAPLVTVVTVVVFANAINLIDGLDGLAAGIVIIAGTALFLYSTQLFDNGFLEGSNVAPLIAVIAVGVCVGFLPWNFNPARIFMGDAGALFLGLLMAVTTITIGGRADYQYTGTTYFFFAPLVIPLLILGVPIVDTAFSFLRRVAAGPLVLGRRQGPPAPPADAARPRSPAHGGAAVALDRAALGPGADPHVLRAATRTRWSRSASSPSRCCCTSSSSRAARRRRRSRRRRRPRPPRPRPRRPRRADR